MKENKKNVYRRGFIVLVALVILTGLEYWIAVSLESVVFLSLTALGKAILILNYFMHMSRLWREEMKR